MGCDIQRRTDRAYGALLGLAVGDALGMPTQMLSRRTIRQRWGLLDGFEPAPDDNEISRGTPAARVTDDTDQAVLVARLLLAGDGVVDARAFADALLDWERGTVALGSADLLGPSTRRALSAVAAGESPERSGRWGDTNGAAMRIAPVGIAYTAEPLDRLVDAVATTNRVTHDTTVANAGAAAVAAAVSAGVDGAPLVEATAVGLRAARAGAVRGSYVGGADVAARIGWALDLVADRGEAAALDLVYTLVGTGVATQETVPAAFALARLAGADPWRACRLAASLGGDADTVAAITGAIVGAVAGAHAFPADAVERLATANPELDLRGLAADLLALRDRAA